MTVRRSAFLTALWLTVSISACAARYPMIVKDCRGKQVTIPKEPKRIVSLAPNNTEILYALGLESRIVGVTRFCDYPPAARKKPKVGDRTTSTETVISLRPDLVVAHGTLNDDAVRALESHGIRVFALDPTTIGDVARDIRIVGRITNRERQSEKVAARIGSAKQLVVGRVKAAKTRPGVLVAAQADPLWAAGPKTFVNEMVAIAHGANVAHDARPGFNLFSVETAVSRDPDVIIGTTIGDKQVFTRGVWKETKAARTGRVYEADADLLFRPGPRLADGILAIARTIHPELFTSPTSKTGRARMPS